MCDKTFLPLNERFTDNAGSEVLLSTSNIFNPVMQKSNNNRDVDILLHYLWTVGMLGHTRELSAFVDFSHAMLEQGSKTMQSGKRQT